MASETYKLSDLVKQAREASARDRVELSDVNLSELMREKQMEIEAKILKDERDRQERLRGETREEFLKQVAKELAVDTPTKWPQVYPAFNPAVHVNDERERDLATGSLAELREMVKNFELEPKPIEKETSYEKLYQSQYYSGASNQRRYPQYPEYYSGGNFANSGGTTGTATTSNLGTDYGRKW